MHHTQRTQESTQQTPKRKERTVFAPAKFVALPCAGWKLNFIPPICTSLTLNDWRVTVIKRYSAVPRC